jgi:diguanylate cyclase (GGDEF)-like protein/PAS domain S-box-containing protein
METRPVAAPGPAARARRHGRAQAWRLAAPAQSPPEWAGKVALLAALYFVTGWLGLQLAQPPGYATAIWPPSGLMLAALLLWSRTVWPGVWLGSLLLNLWVGYDRSGVLGMVDAVIAAILATGSTLQGLVGAGLVKRFVGVSTALESGRQIVRFILFGGPLACVIAATIGIGTLYLSGRVPAEHFGYSWMTWWVGDSMGVFLVAPLALLAVTERRASWRPRVRVVAITVAGCLLAGALIVAGTNRNEQQHAVEAFEQHAAEIDRLMMDRLDEARASIRVIGEYIRSDEEVDSTEFGRLSAALVEHRPEIRSLRWVELFPGKPGAAQQTVAQVRFVYPADAEGPAIGEVIEVPRLYWGSQRRLSEHFFSRTPISAAGGAARFDLYGMVAGNARLSRLPMAGYVVAHVDLEMLTADIVGEHGFDTLAVQVRDDVSTQAAPHRSSPAGLQWTARHLFAGRGLQTDISIGDQYVLSNLSQQAWLTQFSVLLFSALLSGFLMVLTGRSARVEQLVEERTRELAQKNADLQRESQQRQQGEAALAHSEERFRTVFDSAGTAIAFADASGHLLSVNDAFARLVGYDRTGLIGMNFGAFTHPDDLAHEKKMIADLVAGRSNHFRIEKRYIRRDGRELWVDVTVSAPRNADGTAAYLVGVVTDIDERKQAERHLRLSAEVFEHLGEAIMITDADNRIVSVNRAFTTITGYALDEVIGSNPKVLSSGRQARAFYQELWTELLEKGVWQGEVWDRRKSGELYPQWLNISVVRDADGRCTHHVAVFSDISERKAVEERIRYLAEVDALTNLPNRVVLSDRLEQTLELSRRAEQQFAVLFLDIDRFKNINDSLGHSVGDALLRETAMRLRAALRVTDTVTRQGGDEFVILLPDVHDEDQVAHLANKILETVARPLNVEQHVLSTTASIGVAMFPADGNDVETLLKNADAAMYVAKSSGRNNVRFFTRDMNARVQEFLRTETDLRRALAEGELRLHYQPQIDVRSGQVVAAEALVRWQHPERGLILPGQFIHVAEESGLISEIGEWVMYEACRQNREWQQRGLRRIPVSVNLSAMELHRGGVVEQVERVLQRTGLGPGSLEVEVTESMLMRDVEQVIDVLQRLRDKGVLIALDDFGTGYSSLAYLQRFPLSTLKVDRSFVRDIFYDRNDAAICRAIIALGRTLGLKVVAEGVETEEQLNFLRQNHCDSAQGSLFSWGVPPEQMEAFLSGAKAPGLASTA